MADIVFVHVLAEALTVGRTVMPLKIYGTDRSFTPLCQGTNIPGESRALLFCAEKHEDFSSDTQYR